MTKQNQNVLQVIAATQFDKNDEYCTAHQNKMSWGDSSHNLVELAKYLNINPHAIVEAFFEINDDHWIGYEERLEYDGIEIKTSNNDIINIYVNYNYSDSDLNLLSQDAELEDLSYDINNYTIRLSS